MNGIIKKKLCLALTVALTFGGGVTSTSVAHADGWGDIAGAIYGSVILPQLIQIGA